jgi:hypothetical protein
MQTTQSAVTVEISDGKTELPYDPAILLLGINPKEPKSVYNRNTCIPMFIGALFTISSYGISLDAQQ